MTRRAQRPVHLLIDADVIVYKTAIVSHDDFGFGEYLDRDRVVRLIDEEIDQLVRKLKADDFDVCTSDRSGPTFRHDLADYYKAKRGEKPALWMFAREYLENTYDPICWPRLEGDDVLGILATDPEYKPDHRKVIVSIDKDMQTIPGLLFNPLKDKRPRRIKPLQADLFWVWQALVGDTVDNYPGIRRVGPKSQYAADILASTSLEQALGHLYVAAIARGASSEHVLEQLRLARILRHGEYDKKTQEVQLFTDDPPVAPL